jgi:hypothetical protein
MCLYSLKFWPEHLNWVGVRPFPYFNKKKAKFINKKLGFSGKSYCLIKSYSDDNLQDVHTFLLLNLLKQENKDGFYHDDQCPHPQG